VWDDNNPSSSSANWPVPGPADAGNRTCLLVLGMHRSGTSALTRLLSLAGAELPRRLLGAGEGNETGHWEPEALTVYHDALLSEIDSAWHDWCGPDFTKLSKQRLGDVRSELLGLINQDFGNARLFVVKDPRICRFAPLFASALAEGGIRTVPILISRNPLDVVHSLEARAGLWPQQYASADGALLWLRHVLDAEEATRNVARTFVTYDSVLRDWRGTLQRLIDDTGLPLPNSIEDIAPQVEAFLSTDYRHQKHGKDAVRIDPVMRGWISRAFEAMEELAQSPQSAPALSSIGAVRAEFNQALPILSSISSTRAKLADQFDGLSERIATLQGRLDYVRDVLLEREEELRLTRASVEAFENSASYKITAPLRSAKAASNKLTTGTSALASALRRRGGVIPTVKKAVHVLRQQGLSGVRNRVRTLTQLEARTNMPRTVRRTHPLVSVIVPNYNHAAFLEKRLETILAQTYQKFELIMLDDCSSDNSLEIMRRYEEQHPDRARLIPNEKNSGSGYRQWAKGLSLARGSLVWIAESDDWSDPHFLESLLPSLEDESVMLAYVNSAFMDAEGKAAIWSTHEYLNDIDPNLWSRPFQLTAHQLVAKGWATKNLVPNVSSALLRHPGRDSDLLTGPWTQMKICGDWLFYLNLIKGGAVAYLPEMRNFYRVHEASTAKSTFVKDVYYREHEDVARFVVENFDVSREFVFAQEQNLRQHWKSHRADYSDDDLRACYDPSRVQVSQEKKKPSVMMAGFAFAAGGGETLPIFMANMLKARGHAVTFLSCEMEPREPGVRSMLRSDIPIVTDFAHLERVVEDFGIDIIHSHHGWVDSTILDHLSEASRARTVFSMHGMYEMMEEIDQDAVVARIAREADALVFTSRKNLGPFERLGLADSPKLVGIPNALPEVPIKAVDRASLGIPAQAFVACLVSRAIAEKGWDEAVKAVDLAREQSGKDIRLVLIGEGEEYTRLSQPGAVGPHIQLLGFKRNLRDYFAMSDVGLLPSRFRGESFPLTLIDCLAAGRPVLASNVGEIQHMLKAGPEAGGQVAGALFELEDWQLPVAEMAALLARVAVRGDEYRSMLSAVPAAYATFDPEVMVDKYVEVYHRVLRGDDAHSDALAVPA